MREQVLVTGAGGYIGRHVVRALHDRGYSVIAMGRRDLGSQFDALAKVTSVRADVLSPDEVVDQALSESHTVVHLAWEDGFVLNSPAHPLNLSRHYRFLARASELGVDRVAVAGTMHEIGYWEGVVDDETPSRPQNLYGIAKVALRESLLKAWENAPTNLLWLRFFYIVGDDEHNDSVFSKLLAAEREGQSTFPFTTGKNLFDFIDVTRLADQISDAATQEDVVGVINCSSGAARSLASEVERFITERRLRIRLAYGAFPDRPFDSPGVWGDATRIDRVTALADDRRKSEASR